MERKSIKPLPCPFCGGEAEKKPNPFPDKDYPYSMTCKKCGVHQDVYQRFDYTAVKVWNRREDITTLKPCPFCGHRAILHQSTLKDDSWSVGCIGTTCNTVSRDYKTREEAIAAWNARV